MHAARRMPPLAAWLLALWLWPLAAWGVHFDIELRTSGGPVAGSRITTDFYGDLGLAGLLPIDAATGAKIFPGYFGDLEGGPFLTDDPGFQAFAGTFLRGEELHFRAQGSLQYWNPATGRWGPAPSQVTVALFGGIPLDVLIGYTENPVRWQALYDYHAAGTRFASIGVQGPLTAAIDDASRTGAFHAHLDWKISASGGEPPVGAYLVSISLWSPALAGAQPKYLESSPVMIVFERGISDAQMADAIRARVLPPAPARCNAQTLAWQQSGTGCSANAAETASGVLSALGDETGPTVGSASFRCDDGRFSLAGAASCRVLQACAATPLDWQVDGQRCNAAAPASGHGERLRLGTADGLMLGSAEFRCDDGRWSAPESARCAPVPPRDCAATLVPWQQLGAACQATLPPSPSGGVVTAIDAIGPATGTAPWRCTDGNWGLAGAAVCASPRACSRGMLQWQMGAQSCLADAADTPSGETVQLTDNVAPALGQAAFRCEDGRWLASGAASCAVPPPRDCLAKALNWQQGDATCQALVPAGPAGTSLVAADGLAPATGQATFQCVDGQWMPQGGASCSAPRACAAVALQWQQDAHQCNGSLPAAASGQQLLVTDNGAPTLGSASARCLDGQWSAPQEARCAPAPERDCLAQAQSWQREGVQCEAQVAAATAGSLVTVVDGTGLATGSARLRCSDGRWALAEVLACGLPLACAGEQLGWEVAGQRCNASAAATASGGSVLLSDTTAPTLGAASARCTDGRWQLGSDASCAVPPPADCPAQTQDWRDSEAGCSAGLARGASGSSALAIDSTGPATGQARYQCTDGRWAADGAGRCSRPPQECTAQILAWAVQGLSCEATVPAAASGVAALADDRQGPALGQAAFSCLDGQWRASGAAASCAVPDCPVQALRWQQSGHACEAPLPRTRAGALASVQDSGLPTLGWAQVQCLAGQWQAPLSQHCGAWQRDAARQQPPPPWQPPARPPWAPP